MDDGLKEAIIGKFHPGTKKRDVEELAKFLERRITIFNQKSTFKLTGAMNRCLPISNTDNWKTIMAGGHYFARTNSIVDYKDLVMACQEVLDIALVYSWGDAKKDNIDEEVWLAEESPVVSLFYDVDTAKILLKNRKNWGPICRPSPRCATRASGAKRFFYPFISLSLAGHMRKVCDDTYSAKLIMANKVSIATVNFATMAIHTEAKRLGVSAILAGSREISVLIRGASGGMFHSQCLVQVLTVN